MVMRAGKSEWRGWVGMALGGMWAAAGVWGEEAAGAGEGSLAGQGAGVEVGSRVEVVLRGEERLEFGWIPAGGFRQGSPESEAGRDKDEGPAREVSLTKGFWLGKYEVTQGQWAAVMGNNPARFQQGSEAGRRPVEWVSWEDAQRFVARLNGSGLGGRFRLPTEAEWEYACRAGTTSRFPWGEDAEEREAHRRAWANSRSFAVTHPVGEKPANSWGLHDMTGNVWEWCADWYAPYAPGPLSDPTGPAEGRERVFRGGSFFDFPVSLRSANRHRHAPEGRYAAIGVRLVYEPAETRGEVKTVLLAGGTPLRLVRVGPGRYRQGSPDTEAGRAKDEGPARKVSLTKGFWLGQYEVTQAQWVAVMGVNPATFQDFEEADAHPVEGVSWEDCQEFLQRLNGTAAVAGGRFRLPTEAEWEYASRAGAQTRFSWGEDPEARELRRRAWFHPGSEARSHPVGTKAPNGWGFYDLEGNVWEWCEDVFRPYGEGAVEAGAKEGAAGDAEAKARVIRGGSWFNEPEALRSANRHRHPPDSRQTNLGLRVVWEEGGRPEGGPGGVPEGR